jgi:hypothetical protein
MSTPTEEDKERIKSDALAVISTLLNESERAAVILAAARIDSDLEKLLKHVLHRCPGGDDTLFDSDRALGTFSAKIAIAHRLGMLDQDFEHAIQMLRKIRNDFAHQLESESLRAPKQAHRLAELTKWARANPVYDNLIKAMDTGKHTKEHVSLVICCSAMTISLAAGIHQFNRVNLGPPISISVK